MKIPSQGHFFAGPKDSARALLRHSDAADQAQKLQAESGSYSNMKPGRVSTKPVYAHAYDPEAMTMLSKDGTERAPRRFVLFGRGSFLVRLSILFGLLSLILTTVGIHIWQTTERFVTNNEWVSHTYEVEQRTNAVLAHLGRLQADAIAYATTGEPLYLAEFSGQVPTLENDLNSLIGLVQDNPSQVKHVQEFARAARVQRDIAAALVDSRSKSGAMLALADLGIDQTKKLSSSILAEESTLLNQRRIETEHTAMLTRLLTSSAIFLSLLFLALTFWMICSARQHNAHSREKLHTANAQLSEALTETRRMGENMQKLSQFSEMLQSCRTLEELQEGLGSALSALLPRLGCRLALINHSQNLAEVGAHWGQHNLIAESLFAPEDCWALRRGQIYPPDGVNNGFVCKHVHWPNPDLPNANYICLPLAAQGEMIGVLTLDGEDAPTPEERRIALAAAKQLALALANLRLQETLRTQSICDPLTGLFNRRYLEVSMERELQRAERHSQPLAVLMLDVDHFKRFNDTHGHEAGDALLAELAEELKHATRQEDIVCRYGGEEFTIVLHEASIDTALARAEHIRAGIAAMRIEHRTEIIDHISVSIGVAVFPRDGRTAEDLLRRADIALYQAKHAGRNCVVEADDSIGIARIA